MVNHKSFMKEIVIGNKKINEKSSVYIIAEIGLNHQGDVGLAKKLIDIAHEAGADCVKFQKRSLQKLYKEGILDHPEEQEQGGQYLIRHIKQSEFSNAQMQELYSYTMQKGIDFLCTPLDEESVGFLASLNVAAYKIGSPDMTNLKLISKVRDTGKPMIISTGMSFVSEIEQVVKFLEDINATYALLHCNSTYPASWSDLNLRFIKTLQEKYDCPIGYSGHERGIGASLAAVALGAKIIEKHLTMDRSLPGPDHKASLEPEEFKELVQSIRIVETALGEPVRFLSRGEYLNRQHLSKSLVAARDLKKGTVLTFQDIEVKSPGKGTSPLKLNSFVGQRLIHRDVKKDDYLLESDIGAYELVGKTDLGIKHTWGVVARMDDIDNLLRCNSDFVEMHLTSADIKLKREYSKKYDRDLVIHFAEYDEDFLVDLASPDSKLRKRSIDYVNQSLEYGRKLKPLFRNEGQGVKFIIHPGGFNMDSSLSDRKEELEHNLYNSLQSLEAEGFELLLENMPPFPWFFGGQWFGGFFMDSKEIADFSKRTGFGIAFDTSHAALYCNYSKKDFEKYVQEILPVTQYVQIGDAAGLNGEGLGIGDGTVDFRMLLNYLAKTDLWILPEVWQGHKFSGEGFLVAMEKLKTIHPDL